MHLFFSNGFILKLPSALVNADTHKQTFFVRVIQTEIHRLDGGNQKQFKLKVICLKHVLVHEVWMYFDILHYRCP